MTAPCPFCDIVRRIQSARLVYEDSETIAFFPLRPATPGHTLVIPKVHMEEIWNMDLGTVHKVLDSSLTVIQAVRSVLCPEGLNLINSSGQAATQSVLHFHMHVVPRWNDDLMGAIWPQTEVPLDRLDELACRVRAACEAVSA